MNEMFGKICATVIIQGEEYLLCEKKSHERWCNSKPGNYGKGIGRTDNDQHKPARVGLLGELAFSKLYGGKVDFSYKKFGDKQDFIINGKKIDVKCAMKNYGSMLIYYQNEWGKNIPVEKDIYVAGFIEEEDREKNFAKITMVGYATKEDVVNAETKKGKGEHLNKVLKYEKLRQLPSLKKNSTST